MNIKEILDYVDGAIMELEGVEIRDLPDDLHQEFIEVHELLSYISTVLDSEMRLENEEEV